MKIGPFVLLLAATLAPALSAADLSLSDGRVFHDVRILSQTPRTVVISHAGGLASFGKELLPAELRSQYPIDEAAADAAAQREQAAGEAARRAAERQADEKAQARQAAAGQAATSTERARTAAEPLRMQAMRADAARRVERHFHERTCSQIQETGCSAQISDFRPINGDSGPWLVTGTVTIITYVRCEQPRYEERGSPQGGTIRTYREPASRLIPDSEETKPFQAIYSSEGPEPSLTVTSS